MLGASLVSVVGIELGTNECTELGLWGGKSLIKTLGAVDKLSLGT